VAAVAGRRLSEGLGVTRLGTDRASPRIAAFPRGWLAYMLFARIRPHCANPEYQPIAVPSQARAATISAIPRALLSS